MKLLSSLAIGQACQIQIRPAAGMSNALSKCLLSDNSTIDHTALTLKTALWRFRRNDADVGTRHLLGISHKLLSSFAIETSIDGCIASAGS